MFWSDPNLYGVTHPYKEIPTPVPMGMYPPRFLPQVYGAVPPFVTPPTLNPWVRPEQLQTPFLGIPQYQTPFFGMPFQTPFFGAQPFQPPFYGTQPFPTPFFGAQPFQPPYPINPVLSQVNPNLPLHNWIRPFNY